MKVGDYVRTKKGISRITTIDNEQIRKIIYTDTKEVFEYYTDKQGNEIKDYWKSYSSNIIDLIEVGDYVNGYLIKDIDYAFDDVVMNNKNARIVPYIDCNKNNYIDDIKSIVTKEQFENMEYRIGE